MYPVPVTRTAVLGFATSLIETPRGWPGCCQHSSPRDGTVRKLINVVWGHKGPKEGPGCLTESPAPKLGLILKPCGDFLSSSFSAQHIGFNAFGGSLLRAFARAILKAQPSVHSKSLLKTE